MYDHDQGRQNARRAAFGAIGYYYADFSPISDEEVVELLARFPTGAPDAVEEKAVQGTGEAMLEREAPQL